MWKRFRFTIRRVCQYFGYDIVKAPKRRKANKAEMRDKPLYIEFVGLSCVGKTTLFKAIQKRKRTWLTRDEFVHYITSIDTPNSILEKSSTYQFLSKAKLNFVIDKDFVCSDKLWKLHNFFRHMKEDYLIQRFNTGFIVVNDEGVIKNITSGVVDLKNRRGGLYKDFIENRAIIFCYAPAELISRRIIKRSKKTGFIGPGNRGSSFEDMISRRECQLRKKVELIESIKKDIPVLDIDTSLDLGYNVSRIELFIQRLQKEYYSNSIEE